MYLQLFESRYQCIDNDANFHMSRIMQYFSLLVARLEPSQHGFVSSVEQIWYFSCYLTPDFIKDQDCVQSVLKWWMVTFLLVFFMCKCINEYVILLVNTIFSDVWKRKYRWQEIKPLWYQHIHRYRFSNFLLLTLVE